MTRFKTKEQSSNRHTSRFDNTLHAELRYCNIIYVHFTEHNLLFFLNKKLQKNCFFGGENSLPLKLLLKIVSVNICAHEFPHLHTNNFFCTRGLKFLDQLE